MTRGIHKQVVQTLLLATSIRRTDIRSPSQTHTGRPQDQETRLLLTALAVRIILYWARSYSGVYKRGALRLALLPAIVPARGFAEGLLSRCRRSLAWQLNQ